MAEIGGYRSPVDIGLGQTPITQDPELYSEMTDVYNAIHLLNQYLDQLRINAEGGGGSEQDPAETMPFNRFFSSIALQTIPIGSPVAPNVGSTGIVSGALANDYTISTPNSNFCGIALTAGVIGQAIVVGVGPAVIALPGAAAGTQIWAYSSRATNSLPFGDSGLYLSYPGSKIIGGNTAWPMPVATCIRDGFIMFGQYLAR